MARPLSLNQGARHSLVIHANRSFDLRGQLVGTDGPVSLEGFEGVAEVWNARLSKKVAEFTVLLEDDVFSEFEAEPGEDPTGQFAMLMDPSESFLLGVAYQPLRYSLDLFAVDGAWPLLYGYVSVIREVSSLG